MLREAWGELTGFNHSSRALLARLAVVSALAACVEAAVLVVIVHVAANATSESEATSSSLISGLALTDGWLLLLAAFATLIIVGLHALVARLTARIAATTLVDARRRAIESFRNASWDRQAKEGEGSLQETISTLSTQTSNLALSLANGLTAALGLAALIGTALVVDFVATIAVVALGQGLFFVLRPAAALTQRRAAAYVKSSSDFNESATSTTRVAMELRTFGVESEAYGELESRNIANGRRLESLRFANRFGAMLYRDIASLGLIAVAALLLFSGETDIERAGAVVLLVVRSLTYAQGVQTALQTLSEQRPSLAALRDRLKKLNDSSVRTGTATISGLSLVQFRSVGYQYVADIPALEEVDLVLRRGCITGVVGASGSGKSTFVQLLLRLRPPTSGRILVDDLDLQTIKSGCWAKVAALVPQDARLLEASISDNIRFWRNGISDRDVRQAAEDAGVLEEIEALPDGFGHRLGPAGTGLSGGQRQRISIARAIAGSPDVIVLDEPTSALDEATAAAVEQSLVRLKSRLAVVLVTHRASSLRVCDTVYRFDSGRCTLASAQRTES